MVKTTQTVGPLVLLPNLYLITPTKSHSDRMALLNGDSPTERAHALMARKDAIESEIKTQFSILDTHNVTMQTPLVDPDGFPRADIDIWAIRTARVRIIELNNDLKDVMDAIGKALEGVYDSSRDSPVPSIPSQDASSANLKPFAKVESVAPGSPAADAVCLSRSST